jgi:sugar/nucleoside kinase (ribokinase family)
MIVGFGENSVDTVYGLPDYPQPGTATSKLAIQHRAIRPGGQVATMLATCAALGLPTRYVGAFGNDANAAVVREALRRRGVDTAMAFEREADNRYAVILIDASHGERVVLWHRDQALAIQSREVRAEWIRDATLVHVDATDEEAAIALARLARQAGLEVTCDIDQVSARSARLLDSVTIPILAEHVPLALTGEPNLERSLRAIRSGHQTQVIVTLGNRGAAMLDGGHFLSVAGFEVEVVDTTGAGDVFRGAFVYALLRGDRPQAALSFANAAAAASCTRAGAMDAVPTLREIEELLERNRRRSR